MIQKSYYAIIPADVRYDKTLCANAKLLYGEITALCNEKGYCWASNSYFAELYSVTKESIGNWLAALTKAGYIKTEVKYKENSKEVDSRIIKIASNQFDPHEEKFDTSGNNFLDPLEKNKVYNNTINNTTTNKQDKPIAVKLFSAAKIDLEKDKKKDKWVSSIIPILAEYEFSLPVEEAVCQFLDMLAETKTYLAIVTVKAQLNKLMQHIKTDQEKIKVVNDTISKGWKSLDYMIDETLKNKDKSRSFDTAKSNNTQLRTEEQKEEIRNQMQKDKEEGNFI